MSLDNPDVVDAIGVDAKTGMAVLTVSDHLDWTTEKEGMHLTMLQDKLNTYLRFIESGEYLEACPVAAGRSVLVNVVGKCPLSPEAQKFYTLAATAFEKAGFGLTFELFGELSGSA